MSSNANFGIFNIATKQQMKEDVEITMMCIDKEKGYFVPKYPYNIVGISTVVIGADSYRSKEEYDEIINRVKDGVNIITKKEKKGKK